MMQKAKERFYRKKTLIEIISVLLIVLVAIDILVYNLRIFNNINDLNLDPGSIQSGEAVSGFYQSKGSPDLINRVKDYLAMIEDRGNLDCLESVMISSLEEGESTYQPVSPADYIESDTYKGEVYLLNGGRQNFSWSPNKVVVDVELNEEDILVVNQNYHMGWDSDDCDVGNYNGLIGCKIGPETETVTIRYKPRIVFVIGLIVSFVMLIELVVWLVRKGRSDTLH